MLEKVVRKFASFEEADAADRDYYRLLAPSERLSIMLDLTFPEGSEASSGRLERVCRVTQIGKS
jgi:hypothetical protein